MEQVFRYKTSYSPQECVERITKDPQEFKSKRGWCLWYHAETISDTQLLLTFTGGHCRRELRTQYRMKLCPQEDHTLVVLRFQKELMNLPPMTPPQDLDLCMEQKLNASRIDTENGTRIELKEDFSGLWKLFRVLCNVGFVMLHYLGFVFAEVFCVGKALELSPDWTAWWNIGLVLLVMAVLAVHYFLLHLLVKHGLMAKTSLYIVTALETLTVLAVTYFLIFPPDGIYPIVSAHIFAIIVEFLILSARFASWFFLHKKKSLAK